MTSASPRPFDFGRTLLIGIGAQKAGTTWLARKLAAHPQVHVPQKEVHYWDRVRAPYRELKDWRDGILRPGNRLLRELVPALKRGQWVAPSMFRPDPCDHGGYADLFRRGHQGQPVLHEFTPNYAMLSPAVFDEIAGVHEDVRFLLLLRDPVTRFWSGIRHFHRKLLTRGMPEDSLVHIAWQSLADPHDPHRRKSDYAPLFDVPVLASDRTHVAFFETLFTQDSYDAILDFAGLDRQPIGAVSNVNPSRFGHMDMPADLAAEAHRVFAPTYARVAEIFGDRVPQDWGRS